MKLTKLNKIHNCLLFLFNFAILPICLLLSWLKVLTNNEGRFGSTPRPHFFFFTIPLELISGVYKLHYDYWTSAFITWKFHLSIASSTSATKKPPVMDVRQQQKCVTEFLHAEKNWTNQHSPAPSECLQSWCSWFQHNLERSVDFRVVTKVW